MNDWPELIGCLKLRIVVGIQLYNIPKIAKFETSYQL